MGLTDNRTAECHWYRHRTWTRRTNNWNAAQLSMEQKEKQQPYKLQKRWKSAISLYPCVDMFCVCLREERPGVELAGGGWKWGFEGAARVRHDDIAGLLLLFWHITFFTHSRFALLLLVFLSPFRSSVLRDVCAICAVHRKWLKFDPQTSSHHHRVQLSVECSLGARDPDFLCVRLFRESRPTLFAFQLHWFFTHLLCSFR